MEQSKETNDSDSKSINNEDTDIESFHQADTDNDSIYNADTDVENFTDDETDNSVNNLEVCLFLDENGVPYYFNYFIEFSGVEASNVVLPLPINSSDHNQEIVNLDSENLYIYYFLTTLENREE